MSDSVKSTLDKGLEAEILARIPQAAPFRFVDTILEVSEDHSIGQYTFKEDEFFYKGHFPGNPVTPGVILVECMAQIGLVAMSAFIDITAGAESDGITFFADARTDFLAPVGPGETVRVESKKKFNRRGKLQADVQMYNKNGDLVCEGTLSGVRVKN